MARTGRPRSFERNVALEQALLLFWEHGYESTSLAQLKEAMGGISAPSFYAVFESKEALFSEVLERYQATHGRVTDSLRNTSLAPREAVEKTLRDSARMQSDPKLPGGCLLTLSTSTVRRGNDRLQQAINDTRKYTRAGFERCVRAAIKTGELLDNAASRTLATTFDTVLQGITVKAREGMSRGRLDALVKQVMQLWDQQCG